MGLFLPRQTRKQSVAMNILAQINISGPGGRGGEGRRGGGCLEYVKVESDPLIISVSVFRPRAGKRFFIKCTWQAAGGSDEADEKQTDSDPDQRMSVFRRVFFVRVTN